MFGFGRALVRGLSVLLSLSLLLCTPPTWAASSVEETFNFINHGVSPSLTGEALAQTREALTNDLVALSIRFGVERSRAATPSCALYDETFSEVLRELALALTRVSSIHQPQPFSNWLMTASDDDVIQRVRVLALTPQFFTLQGLFKAGRDGGFIYNDPKTGFACERRQRKILFSALTQVEVKLAIFMRTAVGSPGLVGLDQLFTRVLRLAIREETQNRILNWQVTGGTFVASLAAWTFLPALALRAASSVTALSGVLTRPITGITASALTAGAESVAIGELSNALRLDPDEELAFRDLRSFEEQLEDMRRLTRAPQGAAWPLLPALSAVNARLAQYFESWVTSQSRALATANASLQAEIMAAGAMTQELKVFHGRPTWNKLTNLQRWMGLNASLNVTCDGGLSAPTLLECWYGTRQLARAIADPAVLANAGSVLEILNVNFTSDTAAHVRTQGAQLQLRLYSKSPAPQLARQLAEALRGPQARAVATAYDNFVERQDTFKGAHPDLNIEWDSALTWDQRTAMLDILERVGGDVPELLQPEFRLRVGFVAQPLHERDLQLTLGVNVNATASELEAQVRGRAQDVRGQRNAARFARDQADLNRSRERLEAVARARGWPNATVECLPEGGLTVRACARALDQFARWVDINGPSVQRWTRLSIISSRIGDDIAGLRLATDGKHHLFIREDADLTRLHQAFRAHGWLP